MRQARRELLARRASLLLMTILVVVVGAFMLLFALLADSQRALAVCEDSAFSHADGFSFRGDLGHGYLCEASDGRTIRIHGLLSWGWITVGVLGGVAALAGLVWIFRRVWRGEPA